MAIDVKPLQTFNYDDFRRIGFEIDGIDLTYYSIDDFPDGEVAIFMKKRI